VLLVRARSLAIRRGSRSSEPRALEAPVLYPPALAERLRRYARPAALLLAQLVLLSAAMVRDGAPTHHPERALLSAMLLLAILTGDLGLRVALLAPARSRFILATGLCAWIIFAALVFRPWLRREHFAHRADETAIGRAASTLVPPGERVLLEVTDYGYFAVMASFARPEDIVLDRSIDPRSGPSRSSFDDRAALSRRVAESGARFIIARAAPPSAAIDLAGAPSPAAVRGAWAIYRAEIAGGRAP
jgi:hypothetical protein